MPYEDGRTDASVWVSQIWSTLADTLMLLAEAWPTGLLDAPPNDVLLSPVMAFTKTPHRLTRMQSLRVEDDFPDKLKQAAAKAGVPYGALLARLVDQYLAGELELDPAAVAAQAALGAARARVADLAELLGVPLTAEPSAAEPDDEPPNPLAMDPDDPASGFWG